MTKKDIHVGVTVYHSVMAHWGKGEVVKIRPVQDFAGVSRKGRTYEVRFAQRNGITICQASELIKKPRQFRGMSKARA